MATASLLFVFHVWDFGMTVVIENNENRQPMWKKVLHRVNPAAGPVVEQFLTDPEFLIALNYYKPNQVWTLGELVHPCNMRNTETIKRWAADRLPKAKYHSGSH